MFSKTTIRVSAITLCVFMVLMTIGFVMTLQKSNSPLNLSIKTTGTIASAELDRTRSNSSDDGYRYYCAISYTYTVDGQEYDDMNSVSGKCDGKYSVGDTIDVWVSDSDHTVSELYSGSNAVVGYVTAMIVLGLIAFSLFMYSMYR